MKLTSADNFFSKCIRERNHWQCERCGVISEHGRATGGDRAMQCSHFVGRKYKSVRLDPNNCLCLCSKCHAEVEESPGEHTRLYESIFGEGMLEIVIQKKHAVTKPVGGWKAFEKEAAAHYRKEFERMRKLREQGEMGRIEFMGYA